MVFLLVGDVIIVQKAFLWAFKVLPLYFRNIRIIAFCLMIYKKKYGRFRKPGQCREYEITINYMPVPLTENVSCAKILQNREGSNSEMKGM